jgi:hypothetical protein
MNQKQVPMSTAFLSSRRLNFHHHVDLDNLLGGNMEDGTCAGESAGNLESSAEGPRTSLA